MESLKKGNVQSVTFQVGGQENKHFIEANPQFKSVTIYDENMQKVKSGQEQSQKQSQGEAQDSKRANKADVKDAENANEDSSKKAEKKQRGQKV